MTHRYSYCDEVLTCPGQPSCRVVAHLSDAGWTRRHVGLPGPYYVIHSGAVAEIVSEQQLDPYVP